MTTVMVVEDDPAFLARFCRIVGASAELSLLAAVSDLASARRILDVRAPEVLLIDLDLPDGSGIPLIRETTVRYPATDIMVVTVFGDEEHVLASVAAGATGYILKDALPGEFVQLILELRAGGSPISPLIARQLLRRLQPPVAPVGAAGNAILEASSARPSVLSMRESEVLALIAKGFNFAEIARVLEVSAHTITSHVKNIYRKLAVHSRGEAVFEAGRMGLL